VKSHFHKKLEKKFNKLTFSNILTAHLNFLPKFSFLKTNYEVFSCYFPGANTLAYFASPTRGKKKSFLTLKPGVNAGSLLT